MGFVFQAFHLLPHLSIARNVALPLALNGQAGRAADERVLELLEAVGLADRASSFPRELSGGESQRVAVARALAHRPALVLADEPTGNLDPDNAAMILEVLRAQIKRDNAAAIRYAFGRGASTDRVYELTRRTDAFTMSVAAQALPPGRNALRARLSLLDAAAFGPLRQAPGRTLLAVLAIALGVALGFAVYLINRVAADEVQGASRSLFGLADLSVQSPGAGFDESLFPRLLRVPGVAAASPVVEVQVRLPGRERNLKLLGIDPFRAMQLQPALAGAGAATERQGQGLLAENSIWLSPAAAQSLELEVGDDLDVQVALDRVRFRVAGVLPPGAYAQPVGVLDIGEAQWRLQRLGRLDRVDLRLAPQADGQAVRTAIAALLPPGAQVVTPGEATDDAVRLTRAYRSNLTALALVALFTGAFLVYATQSLAVARRRREIALLHAMGMSVREQLAASLLAGTIVGALGAALGVILGALVARAGLAAFGADLGAGYFRGVAPALNVSAGEYLAFFLLGVGAALVATFGPAREAASVPAAAALKAGDEAPLAPRTHGRIALALFAAGILALALPPLEGIALPGYVSIASLLLGAVFLTPSIASIVFSRLRTEGPAWRQVAVAQLRGTASCHRRVLPPCSSASA
jgi:putative ABC transport system permease protein